MYFGTNHHNRDSLHANPSPSRASLSSLPQQEEPTKTQDATHDGLLLSGIDDDDDDDLDMMLVNDPILPPLHADNNNDNNNNNTSSNQNFKNSNNDDSSPQESAITSTVVSPKASSTNPNDDETTQQPNSSSGSTSAVVVIPLNAKNGTTTEPPPPPSSSSSSPDANYLPTCNETKKKLFPENQDDGGDHTSTTDEEGSPFENIDAAILSRPSRHAKSVAATKIRRSSESDGDEDSIISFVEESDDDDDYNSADNSYDDNDNDSEDGSCFGGGSFYGNTQKQNFVTVPNPRPSRRAKSAAVKKLAARCDDASASSEEYDNDNDKDNDNDNEGDEEHNHETDPREPLEAAQVSPLPKKKLLLKEEEDASVSTYKEEDAQSNENDQEYTNAKIKFEDDGRSEEFKKPAAKFIEDSDADGEEEEGLAIPNGTKKRKKAPEKAGSISNCNRGEDDDYDEEENDSISSTKSKKRKMSITTQASATEERDDDSTSRGQNNKHKTPLKVVAIKKEASVKEEEGGDDNGTPKKKPKKPRVSESVVNDAAEKMLVVLIRNYKDEIKQVPLDILAASITSKKGKPYTNHRSDAICDGLKLLQAQNKAEKIKHGKVGAARLLPPEIDKIPKEEISKDPAKALEQRFQQFLDRLAKHKKGGTGENVVKAAKAVWNKLQDGKAYSRKELVARTSYKGTNSSGFEGIMKVLGELHFVEGKGKSSFTDRVFPHGRP